VFAAKVAIYIFTRAPIWLEVYYLRWLEMPNLESVMPLHMTCDEMAALLKILDSAERTIDEGPTLNLQKATELQDAAKRRSENASIPDRNANRFVEQIAAAMLKFRVQRG
jgi:hypothetical protein